MNSNKALIFDKNIPLETNCAASGQLDAMVGRSRYRGEKQRIP